MDFKLSCYKRFFFYFQLQLYSLPGKQKYLCFHRQVSVLKTAHSMSSHACCYGHRAKGICIANKLVGGTEIKIYRCIGNRFALVIHHCNFHISESRMFANRDLPFTKVFRPVFIPDSQPYRIMSFLSIFMDHCIFLTGNHLPISKIKLIFLNGLLSNGRRSIKKILYSYFHKVFTLDHCCRQRN